MKETSMSSTPRRTTRPIGMPKKMNANVQEEQTTEDPMNEDAERNPAEQEAESIMESIAEKPEVCHALYEMLEEKYANPDNKEVATDDIVSELKGNNEEDDGDHLA